MADRKWCRMCERWVGGGVEHAENCSDTEHGYWRLMSLNITLDVNGREIGDIVAIRGERIEGTTYKYDVLMGKEAEADSHVGAVEHDRTEGASGLAVKALDIIGESELESA